MKQEEIQKAWITSQKTMLKKYLLRGSSLPETLTKLMFPAGRLFSTILPVISLAHYFVIVN